MAYRSHTASPCESGSPSSSSSSTHVSPYSKNTPLEAMVLNDEEESPRSTRTQNAGKGGCWYVINTEISFHVIDKGNSGHAAFDGRFVKVDDES